MQLNKDGDICHTLMHGVKFCPSVFSKILGQDLY